MQKFFGYVILGFCILLTAGYFCSLEEGRIMVYILVGLFIIRAEMSDLVQKFYSESTVIMLTNSKLESSRFDLDLPS